jgi:hypothetical protein
MRSSIIAGLAVAASSCSTPAVPDESPPDAATGAGWILDDLDADAGFSVRTPAFDVAAGTEVQDCYFFRVPDLASGADLMIDRFELGLNRGSHHLNAFRVKTIVGLDPAAGEPVAMGGGISGTVVHGGECWKGGNWADWPLVANSQQSTGDDPKLDWRLPAGVAERFAPGEPLMLQVHYVNATSDVLHGKGGINFHRSHDGDAIELGTLFATQKEIRVCRSTPTPHFAGACVVPDGAHTVIASNGHFHSRGTRFQMYAWTGDTVAAPAASSRFYENVDWAEPRMVTDLSVPLPDGGGVWWSCDYKWSEPPGGCAAVDAKDPLHANDCCYTFGPIVEVNEHCNAFVYYYPKAAAAPQCGPVTSTD